MPNNKKGTRYTKEFKDSILKRLDQPSNETASLSESELAEYCRRKGIYIEK